MQTINQHKKNQEGNGGSSDKNREWSLSIKNPCSANACVMINNVFSVCCTPQLPLFQIKLGDNIYPRKPPHQLSR